MFILGLHYFSSWDRVVIDPSLEFPSRQGPAEQQPTIPVNAATSTHNSSLDPSDS